MTRRSVGLTTAFICTKGHLLSMFQSKQCVEMTTKNWPDVQVGQWIDVILTDLLVASKKSEETSAFVGKSARRKSCVRKCFNFTLLLSSRRKSCILRCVGRSLWLEDAPGQILYLMATSANCPKRIWARWTGSKMLPARLSRKSACSFGLTRKKQVRRVWKTTGIQHHPFIIRKSIWIQTVIGIGANYP